MLTHCQRSLNKDKESLETEIYRVEFKNEIWSKKKLSEKSKINIYRRVRFISIPAFSTKSQIDLIFNFNYRTQFNFKCFQLLLACNFRLWHFGLISQSKNKARRRAETLLKINRKIAVKYSARWILHNIWIFLIWVDCFTLEMESKEEVSEEEAQSLISGKSNEYLSDWSAFYFHLELLLRYREDVMHRFSVQTREETFHRLVE